MPLAKRNNRIANRENVRNNFDPNFPPVWGLIPLCISVSVAYGMIAVLPWQARYIGNPLELLSSFVPRLFGFIVHKEIYETGIQRGTEAAERFEQLATAMFRAPKSTAKPEVKPVPNRKNPRVAT